MSKNISVTCSVCGKQVVGKPTHWIANLKPTVMPHNGKRGICPGSGQQSK